MKHISLVKATLWEAPSLRTQLETVVGNYMRDKVDGDTNL
jgi:hypothetical protein